MRRAQASCLRFAGILPGFKSEDASGMLANRRQDVGRSTNKRDFLLPGSAPSLSGIQT